MEKISNNTISARTIVFAGLTAAAYFIATIILGPLAYGPLQFRLSGLLKPLALRHPFAAWGLAVGVGFANLFSPFGAWDFVIMPIITLLAATICYKFRQFPIIALFVQALIISIGVAVFPLGIGAGLPWIPTTITVFISESILYIAGYFLLRKTPLWDSYN